MLRVLEKKRCMNQRDKHWGHYDAYFPWKSIHTIALYTQSLKKKSEQKISVDWKINIVYVLEMIYVLFSLLIMIIDSRCLMRNTGRYLKKLNKILI